MDIDVNGSVLKDGDPPPGPSSSTAKPFRIKIYPISFAGPFVVYFRKKQIPINVLLISAKIKEKYSKRFHLINYVLFSVLVMMQIHF